MNLALHRYTPFKTVLTTLVITIVELHMCCIINNQSIPVFLLSKCTVYDSTLSAGTLHLYRHIENLNTYRVGDTAIF